MVEHDWRNIAGKNALVVGLGISGFWAARWLLDHGAKVTVTDSRRGKDLPPEFREGLAQPGLRFELGGHRRETFLQSDVVIVSPGVPHTMVLFQEARDKGIEVIGELELAGRIIQTPVIAVTGTNGKSTVTACLGFLLEQAGIGVFVGGNIGTPLMSYACGPMDAEYVVVEVSSFQLDTAETFSPYISIILNISPDHLDRYEDFEAYGRAKKRIFARQGPGQYLIVNNEDELLAEIHSETGVSILRYGLEKKEGQAAFLEDGVIKAAGGSGNIATYFPPLFRVQGYHNILNFQAVILVGHLLGIDSPVIQQALEQFEGLPHRLERVGEKNGVVFYNDSKATNVDAAIGAIQSLLRPIFLIAGGRHKGLRYERLAAVAAGRVKKAMFMGEAKNGLGKAFDGVVGYQFVEDMDEAVNLAFSEADPGDAVLLAPACSSFDMFRNYKDRGDTFRKAVERIIHA